MIDFYQIKVSDERKRGLKMFLHSTSKYKTQGFYFLVSLLLPFVFVFLTVVLPPSPSSPPPSLPPPILFFLLFLFLFFSPSSSRFICLFLSLSLLFLN